MATIKKFRGVKPPVLKKGELATDNTSIYLRNKVGVIEKFVHKKRMMAIIKEEVELQFAEHINNYHK